MTATTDCCHFSATLFYCFFASNAVIFLVDVYISGVNCNRRILLFFIIVIFWQITHFVLLNIGQRKQTSVIDIKSVPILQNLPLESNHKWIVKHMQSAALVSEQLLRARQRLNSVWSQIIVHLNRDWQLLHFTRIVIVLKICKTTMEYK